MRHASLERNLTKLWSSAFFKVSPLGISSSVVTVLIHRVLRHTLNSIVARRSLRSIYLRAACS